MTKKSIPNPYGVSPQTPLSNTQGQTESGIPAYKNNTLAITSLVLGILSILFYFLTAIPGIITGHMARSRANKMPELYEGKGMALAGLILSYIMLLISIAIIAGMFYMFNNYPEFKDAFIEGMQEGMQEGFPPPTNPVAK